MGRKIKCPKCGERFKIAKVDWKLAVARIESGASFQTIADEFNVTRARIAQIAKEAGFKVRAVRDA